MFKVTEIQFFDYTYERQIGENEFETVIEYSANIVINNDFMIQCAGSDIEGWYSFPESAEACWNSDEAQDSAREKYELDEIVAAIENEGVENNFGWLSENGMLQ